MLTLINTVSHWLHAVGVAAIFAVLFVECFGVPSPDEIILLFSGYLISLHRFHFDTVIPAAVLGSTLGASGAYALARFGGRALLHKVVPFVFRHPERLDEWEQYFQRRGDIIVLIGRIISGVRAIISYPAGLFSMPYWRFLAYTVVGSSIWALFAVSLGYLLGPRVVSALVASKQYEGPILGAIVLGLALWYLIGRWRRRKKRSLA
ncbi:MAG: DedA family protein [Firmicutes bacterium]|nr:DedA family protein [Bacillota bacterium]